MDAAEYGYVEVVKKLIASGAKIDMKNSVGYSEWCTACLRDLNLV